MIDPFTIITVLSSYATGIKISGLVSDLISGRNIQHFQNGGEYFTKGIENHDSDFLQKAISEFDCINSNEDKLFVVAFSYLYRAMCYTYLFKFSLAYHYLDKLEKIDYGFFTFKKDTIEETKNDGRSFRNEVEKLEKAYNDYLDSDSLPKDKTIWKRLFIVLSVIVVIGISIALFLFLF